MPYRFHLFDLLIVLSLVTLIMGCHEETPNTAFASNNTNNQKLLEQLTDTNESERFSVLEAAKKKIGDIDSKHIEATLTSLRQKNVSTLIYVCIKTSNPILYRLSPPARQALENSTGSFPNIAYYYARVNPDEGLDALIRLYERYPDKRLPICLAIGEVCQKKANEFLLAEAKAIKAKGGMVTDMLAGLKHSCHFISDRDLEWFFMQSLDREELIILSELDFTLPLDKVKAYWKSGGAKRFFAIEYIMGAPDKHFEALNWMIDQYMDAGDADTVRQLLMSDGMRTVDAPRVRKLRDATLQKVAQR